MSTTPDWVPLKLLQDRFAANVAALATRYPQVADTLQKLTPTQPYFIQAVGDQVLLAKGPDKVPLPISFHPEGAQVVVSKMFPEGKCDEATLVAGEDMGWLWNALYRLPCIKPTAPGYRPPLYFLMRDVERLWVILHVQDWQQMLADQRARFFIGDEPVVRFEQSLHEDVICPWPKLSVTIDKTLWPQGVSLDTIITAARHRQSLDLLNLLNRMQQQEGKTTPELLAAKILSGAPLRILGLVSRYTTFLQYSMRDWLAGLARLGHHTELMIEEFDHHVPNNMSIAIACDAFKPDLLIAIDHPRPALFGVLGEVPVVMWVQDRLPAIYSKECGAKQGPMDYVIGYSRQELTQRCGFPAPRFMPAMVGVNDTRFIPRDLTASERDRFACDVSFVSHCTMPAEQIIQEEKAKIPKQQTRDLLDDLFQQLRGVYDAGDSVSNGTVLQQMVDQTLARRNLSGTRDVLLELFTHRVNNSLFRHQTVRWAAQSGANLHLYGNGWDKHPEFSRFARGVADNQDQLPIIYQASAINLQVTPFGAVHQRLLDGLVAGGFFLLRSVTADDAEPLRKQIWDWCKSHDVTSGPDMLRKSDDQLMALLSRYQAITSVNPNADIDYFYAGLDEASMDHFQRTANTMWIESPRVTFANQQQLTQQIQHFLTHADERKQIAALMRQRVLETHTYRAISERMLKFIAADLASSALVKVAA